MYISISIEITCNFEKIHFLFSYNITSRNLCNNDHTFLHVIHCDQLHFDICLIWVHKYQQVTIYPKYQLNTSSIENDKVKHFGLPSFTLLVMSWTVSVGKLPNKDFFVFLLLQIKSLLCPPVAVPVQIKSYLCSLRFALREEPLRNVTVQEFYSSLCKSCRFYEKMDSSFCLWITLMHRHKHTYDGNLITFTLGLM